MRWAFLAAVMALTAVYWQGPVIGAVVRLNYELNHVAGNLSDAMDSVVKP